MDLHERQQFDFLLHSAVERFVERLEQKNQGAENALHRLREDPNGKHVWLDTFTNAIFADFLLDNVAGACFVLSALERGIVRMPFTGKIGDVLIAMAKSAFANLLRQKTEETLEQRTGYQAVETGEAQ
jgi:hypothetical protein